MSTASARRLGRYVGAGQLDLDSPAVAALDSVSLYLDRLAGPLLLQGRQLQPRHQDQLRRS
jgi:hypothetical protein